MKPSLPLAAAQARLGRPGRPRKAPVVAPPTPPPTESARPRVGPARPSAPLLAQLHVGDGAATGSPESAFDPSTLAPGLLDRGALAPRLLAVPQAAAYLGIRTTSLKALIAAGVLQRVLIPGEEGRDLRRTLLDRYDLDRMIAVWKA